MEIYGIPTDGSNQSFQISADSVTYTLRIKWNPISEHWLLDIMDADGNALCCSAPLLSGTDCISHCHYVGLNGEIRLPSSDDSIPPGIYSVCYVKR